MHNIITDPLMFQLKQGGVINDLMQAESFNFYSGINTLILTLKVTLFCVGDVIRKK